MVQKTISKRRTIKDVGHLAGVSPATVSKAFNQPDLVAEATRAKVLDAASELGYRPNRAARGLVGRRSYLVGYRLPSVGAWGNPTLDAFLHAMVDAAGEHGLEMVLSGSGDGGPLDAYESMVQAGSVDGFVLTDLDYGDVRVEFLARAGIPFVAFGRSYGQAAFPWVDVDGAAGTAAAVRHLRDEGHDRIGVIGWPEGSGTGDDRVRGAFEAAMTLGLPAPMVARAENTIDGGAEAFAELMAVPEPPTGIVAVQDLLALGAHRAATARDLRIGSDVGIVGFDDNPFASVVDPALSSVRQPFAEVGQRLVHKLVSVLDGTDGGSGELVVPELVVRDSSRRTQ